MTEEEQEVLAQAAFHTWVMLGDLITDAHLPKGMKAQVIACYDALTRALPPTLPKK